MAVRAPITIGSRLSLADVQTVARQRSQVALDTDAREVLRRARDELEADLQAGEIIYGANTGFGALSETRIEPDRLQTHQHNLLRSHAVGVGPPFAVDVVRALVLLRAHTLALGACGASPGLLDALLALLDHGVIPSIPSQGSVGASGDLAPLAHLALPLTGEGEAWVMDRGAPSIPRQVPSSPPLAGREALASAGLSPYALGPKEGLSLINGTQVTTGVGALALWDAGELLATCDVIGALTIDAMMGSIAACDPRIHAGKPHPGQRQTAATVAELVQGSPLNASHRDCGLVQDAYSLRCMPQVHGSVRDALTYVAGAVEIEINSFTDNPLLLARPEGGYDVVSGGNFHAATVALPLDHMAAALTTLATISERRTERMVNAHTSRGLPPFLADDPGLESGFMMAQVTAAALASECKTLAVPASVDTIPTSAGKEDHVSMGPLAARKLAAIVDNLACVLAIEAAAAARAIDLRPHATSPRLQAVHAAIRKHVAPFAGDRSMSAEVESLASAICAGELRAAAELGHELAGR